MRQLSLFSKDVSRRAFLRALGGAGIVGLGGLAGCALISDNASTTFEGPGLGTVAARLRRHYGAAIQSGQLDDADFADALKREVNLLVPETELKWNILRPSADEFDFRGYRRIANFAHDNNMSLRGHTLLWHQANPQWLEAALMDCGPGQAEKILRAHIQRIVAETADTIRDWDVVNEAVDPRSPRADGLRETLWLQALGPDHIPLAFNIAHEADDDLTLVYNDFGLEGDDGYARDKRRALLHLLIKCRKQKTPIHALGLQSHLQCHRPLGGTEFVTFLKQVHRLGYEIYVTELDLDLSHMPGSIDDRGVIAQDYVSAYLDLLRQADSVDTLLTWGLSDRYTWLNEYAPTAAGALPLDANLNRGPLWETLRSEWAAA